MASNIAMESDEALAKLTAKDISEMDQKLANKLLDQYRQRLFVLKTGRSAAIARSKAALNLVEETINAAFEMDTLNTRTLQLLSELNDSAVWMEERLFELMFKQMFDRDVPPHIRSVSDNFSGRYISLSKSADEARVSFKAWLKQLEELRGGRDDADMVADEEGEDDEL